MAELDPCRSCGLPDEVCLFCPYKDEEAQIFIMKDDAFKIKAVPGDMDCQYVPPQVKEYLMAEAGGIVRVPAADLPEPTAGVELEDNPVIHVLFQAADLTLRKSKNYAGFKPVDVFANFRECEAFGIPAWLGVLTRMSDKWGRIKTLAQGTPDLVGESFEDTLLDLLVYSAICICLYREAAHEHGIA